MNPGGVELRQALPTNAAAAKQRLTPVSADSTGDSGDVYHWSMTSVFYPFHV
jgi:hypothetical protein